MPEDKAHKRYLVDDISYFRYISFELDDDVSYFRYTSFEREKENQSFCYILKITQYFFPAISFDIVAKGSISTPGITLSINPITARYLFPV